MCTEIGKEGRRDTGKEERNGNVWGEGLEIEGVEIKRFFFSF